MNDSERVLGTKLGNIIEQLPEIVNGLSDRVRKPSYVEDGVDSRFLYESPTWLVYQLLKGVRVVSGLRGVMILLQYGHAVEAASVLRTVGDFIGEMMFAQDAIKSEKPTPTQQREFASFFEDFRDHTKRQYAGKFKVHRPERGKIQAAQARYFNPENPYEVKKLITAIDHAMSGYIHGSYSTVMEMYEGHREEFDMQGVLGSRRMTELLEVTRVYTEMALAALALMAVEVRDGAGLTKLEMFRREVQNA